MLTNITLGKIAAWALALTVTAMPAFGHGPDTFAPGQGQRGPGAGMMDHHMMGPGMTPYGQGWMGHGGMHHGHGMSFGQGQMGYGGMHHGPGWTGPGRGGYGFGRSALRQDLTADDVKHILEHRLQWQGFTNLRVGDIAEKDDDTLTAEVVTADGTLVQRFKVNRHTGAMSPVQED
jgi:hypothetical protein